MKQSAPPTKAELVDALFAPWSRNGRPGAAVIVIHDREVLHQNCYGLADIATNAPISPKTSFLLASVTKQFTAMAIMILSEWGELKFEDSVSKFFPQFHGMARTITIQHLLHHTSGLPEYVDLFTATGQLDDNWPRSVHTTPSAIEPTAKETLELLARQRELAFHPGDKYVYTNSGYVVLAQIVEKVSGKRFSQFVKREIFRKIGMDHSLVFDETQPRVPNRATSYSWRNGQYTEIDYSPLNSIYGPDGIYTTIEDIIRWDQALQYSNQLVTQSCLQRAFTPGTLNDGQSIPYGYGWCVAGDDVSHSGSWLGFRTYIFRCPRRSFTVVVLANCAQLNASCMGDLIAWIYLDQE